MKTVELEIFYRIPLKNINFHLSQLSNHSFFSSEKFFFHLAFYLKLNVPSHFSVTRGRNGFLRFFMPINFWGQPHFHKNSTFQKNYVAFLKKDSNWQLHSIMYTTQMWQFFLRKCTSYYSRILMQEALNFATLQALKKLQVVKQIRTNCTRD